MKHNKKDMRKDSMMKHRTHWEMDVSSSIFPKFRKNNPQDAFIAKNPKDWPQPHIKINETDY